jgi:hypothetical protein
MKIREKETKREKGTVKGMKIRKSERKAGKREKYSAIAILLHGEVNEC